MTKPTLTIPSNKMAPEGHDGNLTFCLEKAHVISRSQRERVEDIELRAFKVTARLGKTPYFEDKLKIELSAPIGESYLKTSHSTKSVEFKSKNNQVIEFKLNDIGEFSSIVLQCNASSADEARQIFWRDAVTLIDNFSHAANCPVFINSIQTYDLKNEVICLDYTTPHQAKTLGNSAGLWHMDMLPIYALYRDAKNSNSNFYKFLCYHKILDGLLVHLKSKAMRDAKSRGISPQISRDLIPNDPKIPMPLRAYIGTPITKFFYEVLGPRFRDGMAHFIKNDGEILNLSHPDTVKKYTEILYLTELCTKQMISTHSTLLTQIYKAPKFTDDAQSL